MTTTIRFTDLAGDDVQVGVRRVIIAGFTGRDQAAVQEHIDELAELGVPVPGRTPACYTVDPALLTTAASIAVDGTFTSGEVEPVVVVHDGRRWLTVGSDHTDRDLERSGIEASKRACPKPIADRVVPLDDIEVWDTIELTSWIADDEGDPAGTVYQRGRLGQILPLDTIVAELADQGIALADGDVLFLGTVPVVGGLRPAARFRAELHEPARGWRATVQYTIDRPQ